MAEKFLEAFDLSRIPAHWGMSFTRTRHREPSAAIDPAKVTLPDGYVVLITGAGKGIGEYIAKAFAQAKASKIIITARTQSDLERVKKELEAVAPVDVHVVAADATDPKACESLAKLITTKFDGRLDCLVCNAGGGDTGLVFGNKFADLDPAEYAKDTSLNYLGAFYAAKYLVPLLLGPNGVGKTIINISSAACHAIGQPPSSYGISKMALNRLTEVLSSNYSSEGLVTIALHPGGVWTPGAQKIAPWMKTVCQDDIRLCGAMCVWLSNERPEWLSGRYVDTAWDVDELNAKKDEIVQHDKLKMRMVV